MGYGGSCFPKDVRALIQMHRQAGLQPLIAEAVEEINRGQKLVLVHKIKRMFGENLAGKTFALWGLAFKPKTDDMREAPAVVIINALIEAGARVRAYDPAAMEEARRIFGDRDGLSFGQDQYSILEGADALILVTEWHQFRYPDLEQVNQALSNPVLFDGRNLLNDKRMYELGFKV